MCLSWTDVTSPCLHRSYSCGTVIPACKVRLGQLHVYIDELLRGNLQKRERLGGEPTSTPWGRLEPGSLGKKERRASADAMREARARESQKEVESRRRANDDAMSEVRARQTAVRGWSHICLLAFRKYCCWRPNVHTKVAEASEATWYTPSTIQR